MKTLSGRVIYTLVFFLAVSVSAPLDAPSAAFADSSAAPAQCAAQTETRTRLENMCLQSAQASSPACAKVKEQIAMLDERLTKMGCTQKGGYDLYGTPNPDFQAGCCDANAKYLKDDAIAWRKANEIEHAKDRMAFLGSLGEFDDFTLSKSHSDWLSRNIARGLNWIGVDAGEGATSVEVNFKEFVDAAMWQQIAIQQNGETSLMLRKKMNDFMREQGFSEEEQTRYNQRLTELNARNQDAIFDAYQPLTHAIYSTVTVGWRTFMTTAQSKEFANLALLKTGIAKHFANSVKAEDVLEKAGQISDFGGDLLDAADNFVGDYQNAETAAGEAVVEGRATSFAVVGTLLAVSERDPQKGLKFAKAADGLIERSQNVLTKLVEGKSENALENIEANIKNFDVDENLAEISAFMSDLATVIEVLDEKSANLSDGHKKRLEILKGIQGTLVKAHAILHTQKKTFEDLEAANGPLDAIGDPSVRRAVEAALQSQRLSTYIDFSKEILDVAETGYTAFTGKKTLPPGVFEIKNGLKLVGSGIDNYQSSSSDAEIAANWMQNVDVALAAEKGSRLLFEEYNSIIEEMTQLSGCKCMSK